MMLEIIHFRLGTISRSVLFTSPFSPIDDIRLAAKNLVITSKREMSVTTLFDTYPKWPSDGIEAPLLFHCCHAHESRDKWLVFP